MSTSEPLVCAVMLTRDRPAMARRAVEAFMEQTYSHKRLCILDTSLDPMESPGLAEDDYESAPECRGLSVGKLRNYAMQGESGDIFFHWDDDDWSHPNRIAEQVALLQSSGADLVGYREMLFWREGFVSHHHRKLHTTGQITTMTIERPGEAWLYQSHRADHVLGTSFCYWRRTWERKKFADLPKGPAATGEDWTFLQGLKVASETAMRSGGSRMIASIHPGNSSQAYDPENHPREWRRAPEWDDYCLERMRL